MRVMLISDATEVFDDLTHCLQMMGHVVDPQSTPRDGIAAGLNGKQDLVIIMDHDSFVAADFIRDFRDRGYCDPVLIVTGDDEEESRIAGFNAGADQVVGSNADCDEWAARVRTLLRNCRPYVADRLTYGDVTINLHTMTVTRDGRVLDVRGKPFALLEFFLRNPEKVHTRERIADSVWDRNFDLFSNVIEVTVSKLRAQLDNDFKLPLLHTVTGRGYMLGDTPPGAS